MILFGEKSNQILDANLVKAIYSQASTKLDEIRTLKIDQIIEVLDQLSKAWEVDGKYYTEAYAALSQEQTFSDEMLKCTLNIMPMLLSRSALETRLAGEFKNYHCLDGFKSIQGFDGRIYASSRGILTHITAGNVFISFVDSLLMGILTKNINIIKLSSNNHTFPNIFMESLRSIDTESILTDKFALLEWRGGTKEIEDIVKNESNTIIAWGGEEMVKNYRTGLPLHCKLIDYGPKISLAVLTKEASKKDIHNYARRLVNEIIMWDQQACASVQNLFIEKGIDHKELMQALAQAFEAVKFDLGKIDPNQSVEILKEVALAEYSSACEDSQYIKGHNFLLHYESDPNLRASPLNRSLIIKEYKNTIELSKMLSQFNFYLQSASLECLPSEREGMMMSLAHAGIARIAKTGDLMKGMNGAPHDGRYGLVELVRFIPFEAVDTIDDQIDNYETLPITDSEYFKENSLYKTNELLADKKLDKGIIFSSGGTSGTPKFALYTPEEFDQTCELLARGFKETGLAPNTRVMNLFSAGNMWSSFLAVHQALTKCESLIFPMGMNANLEYITDIIDRFKVSTLFGLPSSMIELAQYCLANKINLQVDKIYYAGEHLYGHARELLSNTLGVKEFHSAGYATVDAGFIGYQNADCIGSEHYLFSDKIHLEIIDGEAVVSSLIRSKMPVLRYRTGDQVELTGKVHPVTGDPQFKILGRIDNQINIWGCRVYFEEILKALDELHLAYSGLQVQLLENDIMKVIIESEQSYPDMSKSMMRTLHHHSVDLAKTHELDYLNEKLSLEVLAPGKIPRVERTGKLKGILDKR